MDVPHSDNAEIQILRQRIEKLEKQRGAWRIWVVAGLIAAQVLVLVGLHFAVYSSANIITRNLTIVDEQGHTRAILGCTDNSVGLLFLNRDSKPCGMFTVGDNGLTSLNINDSQGNNKVTLGTNKTGGSVFVVSGIRRNDQGMFLVSVADSALMELRDADSTIVFRAP